ncbi:MAG: dienelactone hydrolase [Verrucomicrobiaceae bacterium]|nr:MAG: dienelactone hydrolase [Verrucomicrobiaceae bacterium]
MEKTSPEWGNPQPCGHARVQEIMRWMLPLAVLCSSLLSLPGKDTDTYDPLEVKDSVIESRTLEVVDAGRGRTLPVRVYLPGTWKAAPVILFSHGLGGSRDNNPYLGNHWASRGYVVVFIQHPGSDESVWKDTSAPQRLGKMREAASAKNLLLRIKDVPVVIDTLTKWNAEKDHPLHDRLDLKNLGMSGHSFGAVTTQAVSGQSIVGGRLSFTESRLSAAVMFSPSPAKLADPATVFAAIRIPCLLMTGTLDTSPVGNMTAEDRLKVFPCLTKAPAWQVVFDKATHMSFGDRDLKGDSGEGNRYHKPILAITTAFWDAHLRKNIAAKEWLNHRGARSVLADKDRWEMNALAKPGL